MERAGPRVFFDLGWTLVDETPAHLARFAAIRSHSSQQLRVTDAEFVRECEKAAALLRRLGESHRLGIIANQSKGRLSRLESFGSHDYFSVVVASAEMGLSKPDPRIFAHAQSLAGCSPGELTMVGDRPDNDIGPAKVSGWQTVRVLPGFSRVQTPRNPTESPDQTIDSLAEISPWLGARPPTA